MGSSGKLILCFAIVFCVIQAITARPRFDGSFLENVKYDLVRKCASLEKDIEKETMNVKHKVIKESMKMLKKAVKEGSPECVESAKLSAEEQLEEKSQEAMNCVQDLKDSIETEVQPEVGLPELMAFRSDFKNKLKGCKNSAKVEFKAVQNNFSTAGKACLI